MHKTIVFGAHSFLASSLNKHLSSKQDKVVRISKNQIDLTIGSNAELVKKLVKPGDSVYFFSAIAPCKTQDQYEANLRIAETFCNGIGKIYLDQFVYISSDAVYSDSLSPITEKSTLTNQNIHGLMHSTREKLFNSQIKARQIIFIRPTSVYGYNDPHNGYGPNSFVRQAKKSNSVNLFGKGEELRDHLSIHDFGHLFESIVESDFSGPINFCTGKVVSFYEIFENIKCFKPDLEVKFIDRTGPIPHNGYRSLDNNLLRQIVGNYEFQSITTYLREAFDKY